MNKKINLVYNRIDNKIPVSNNSAINVEETPHFYQRFSNRYNFYTSDNLPKDIFLFEINWTYKKGSYEAFNLKNGLLLETELSLEIKQRLKNKTAFLLLTILYEGWADNIFFANMHNYFSSQDIPLSQIIYVTNCGNVKNLYTNFCNEQKLVPEINVEYVPTFRVDRTDVTDVLKVSSYTPGKREKTFLCFNRRFSAHRLLFYILAKKKNLLTDFYFSMSKDQPESTSNFLINADHLIQRYPEFGLTSEDIQDANSILPLVLDTPNFNHYPMENSWASVKSYYDSSLINIVNETYFFNNIIHITEKTYKPIAFMQPFIMIGSAGSLKHIQDMGFKTFSEFWDESYDLETDNIKRLIKIMDLVESVSKWSESTKIEFSQNVINILQFNKEHLLNIPNTEVDNFINQYGVCHEESGSLWSRWIHRLSPCKKS